jgi:hypothetical protein
VNNIKYEQLKKVIQKANPEIKGIAQCEFCDGNGFDINHQICEQCEGAGDYAYSRPIRLADVLLAIRANRKEFYVRADGLFCEWFKFASGEAGHNEIKSTYIEWNLKDDNLDNQTDGTKQFLIDLLVS